MMRKLGIIGWVVLAGCASGTVDRAPTAEETAFLAKAAAATTVEERWRLGTEARLKAGLGFGYVAAIREAGKSFSLAAGKRTLEPITPLGAHDFIEIGSISKLFTGILIHLAVEEGKLRLDQRLDGFFPELAGTEAGSVTVGELGLHRSGLPRALEDPKPSDPRNPYFGAKKAEWIAALAKVARTKPPEGSSIRAREYSNLGYAILGLVLEQVYHQAYKPLVETRVLAPLGMIRSGVDRKTQKRKRWVSTLAPGYRLDATPAPAWEFDSFVAATGGIESDAHEMAKFLARLENPGSDRLGRAIAAGMASGIGWDSAPGDPVLWKNGATAGYAAILILDRAQKRAIFVGTNSSLHPDLLAWFAIGSRPGDDLLARVGGRRLPTAEELARVKGYFVEAPGGQHPPRTLRVSEVLGQLVGRYEQDSAPVVMRMVPGAEEDEWEFVDGDASVEPLRISASSRSTTAEFPRAVPPAELVKTPDSIEKYPALEK